MIVLALALAFLLNPPACPTEDATGTVCVWNASERGNGIGRSFVVIGDYIIYYTQGEGS